MPVFISVVIPTFKRPKLLGRCIEAIINQSFTKECFELIVVSDGPDQLTADLVQEIKTQTEGFRILYYELPQKKGPAAARNFGWKYAKGELIAFTDDDCLPSKSWLEDYWKAYLSNRTKAISFAGKVIVPVQAVPTDYEKNVSHLATADFITANCACTRDALKLVNGFDEDFPAAWREDSALEFVFMEHQVPIIKLTNASVIHPVREAPWGVSIQDQKKSMFNALLYKKHPGFYRKKISGQPVWSYYGIILFSLLAVVFFLIQNSPGFYISLIVWFLTGVRFIYNRLKGTNESLSHRLEMIVTSFIIPYLSVFWTLRGAIRYKVFFL